MLLFSISKHIFIFSLVIVVALTEEETDAKCQYRRSAGDLPNKTDIWKYVNSLEKILNFCMRNKNEVDLNLYFGLFLVNVNLKPIVKEKSSELPLDLRVKVNGLVKKCSYILKFFDQMVRKDTLQEDKKNKIIYTLMNQEDDWLDRMSKYHMDTWKQPMLSPSQKEHKFSNWNRYLKDLGKFEKWVPTPQQSDACLISLAKNPHKITDTLTKCKVDDICYLTLLHGSNFGYALTHRLVLMVLARMGRGCYLFTPEIDSALVKRFCGTLYAEANFIAQNNYTEAADLLFEQILLCTVKGHEQFLKKRWLSYITDLQTPNGCISINLTDKEKAETRAKSKKSSKKYKEVKWRLMKQMENQQIDHEYCNSHITGIAAGIYAYTIKLALCAYERRAEFVETTKITLILELQREYGDCVKAQSKIQNSQEFSETYKSEFKGCFRHTAGVAAAALSAVLNYILTTQY